MCIRPNAGAALLAAAAALLFFAAPRAHAAEDVVITLKDGKKEKGELLKYDFDNLELRYHVGGNHLDVKIPWANVKEVSNGLTPEIVEKRWREENKDRLCADCGGKRKVDCAKCGGTGRLPKAMVDCAACKGTGTAACPAKGCVNGQVDCTGNCIRLNKGEWVKGEDGQRWCRFKAAGGGFFEWSEGHCGEVVELKDGKWTNLGKCPICGGTTKITCATCKGTGTAPCTACKGAKQVPVSGAAPKCDACKDGKTDCATCKGTGLKPE